MSKLTKFWIPLISFAASLLVALPSFGKVTAQADLDILEAIEAEHNAKDENVAILGSGPSSVLRVGIMSSDGLLNRQEIIRDFVGIVRSSVSRSTTIQVDELAPGALAEAVRRGQIDIFLANSVFYRSMITYGVKDIATVHSEWTPNPNSADGAAIVVSRSNTHINGIKDLQGQSVSVSSTTSPDSWYFALGAVKDTGADPDAFFDQIIQTHGDNVAVINKVLTGQTVAGVLPACFLELFVMDRPQIFEEVKVLDYLKSSELPCTISTPLYPNWTVAITPSISMTTARVITKNLLSIPENPPRSWWAVSTKFDEVDRLLRDLKVEQFAFLREWSVKRVIREYGLFLGAFIALFVGLAFYGFFANRMIKKRSRQLAISLARQAQVQRKLESAHKNLTALSRMGLLTQVSNILMHELRQPLSAIKCYVHGLNRQIENKAASDEKIASVLEIMEQKADFAEDMIRKIRAFARRGTQREKVLLADIVDTATENFLLGSQNTAKIVRNVDRKISLYADPFELELILVNLLRNASESMANQPKPKIEITGSQSDGFIELVVSDNGKLASDEEIQRIFQYVNRADILPDERGRGVGLLIVRSVVESLEGKISFSRRHPTGLTVGIKFPLESACRKEVTSD